MPETTDRIYDLLKELKIDIKEDLKEIRDIHLAEIKSQVQKTNGRVSTLETWRSVCVGGISVLASIPIISQVVKMLK